MSRISARFAQLKTEGRKALIAFVTAGDPDLPTTLAVMRAMVAAGADVIELGVPFSDPMADGPVIQRASERALANRVGLKDVLALVARFRADDAATPVVLMGYANPIEAMGVKAFAQRAADAGVDGVLTVDYPPEECPDYRADLAARGLDAIFLVAPTSTAARRAEVAALSTGFIYYVSLKGVTGSAHLDAAEVAAQVAGLRAQTAAPVVVGFGIRDAASARALGACADGVVVGSRIVQEIEQGAPGQAPARVGALIGELRRALDAAPR